MMYAFLWKEQHLDNMLLAEPPPQEAPYQEADEEHAAVCDPLVHALPAIDDAQQRV